MVRLVDDGWMEGDWGEYLQASSGNGPSGPECLALAYLAELEDLNLYMVMEDLTDELGEDGWEHLRSEETTPLTADVEGITCFPVFELTFGCVEERASELRSALIAHLPMAELSLGSRSDDVSPEGWDAFLKKAQALGVDWSEIETVILMNPRVRAL